MTRETIQQRIATILGREAPINEVLGLLTLEDLLVMADEILSGWEGLEAASIRAQVDLALRQLQAMLSYENR